jgi:hypothetical protein
VDKLCLVLAFGTVSNIGPASLKRLKFEQEEIAEHLLTRQPHFEVVGLGRRELKSPVESATTR